MSGLFNDILVPIDFYVNTEFAVRQAIELASPNGSTIHLLHVTKQKNFWSKLMVNNSSSGSSREYYHTEEVAKKLGEWKQTIEETIQNCNVKTYLMEGAIHDTILRTAKQIKPQLIIISKKGNCKSFSFFCSVHPNNLAKSTDCPVLTITSEASHTRIKIIVVPVSTFIPKRKIELAGEFAKKYRAKIHVVSLCSQRDMDRKSFLDTYQILRTGLTNQIEYHLLPGNNFPKALVNYAKRIGADLMFVNPGSETKLSTLTGKHINDTLKSTSKLKILSVKPYCQRQAVADKKN
jgi:nucleotide-binding universal stress UspA family protein